ncbi:hypothetical protein [Odoribacter lunatus]|uniref:hypothetical protein n=1 Tax=Odoribacter lunatus TaxID=2941335 RepID=UPI00203D4990|nr:hypothetical protein [Odoribacter lunatus]
MRKESEKILNNFKERIFSYVGIKLELLKLNTCERAAKICAALTHSLILFLLGLFLILFMFFALGFFLGEITGRLSVGFLIVTLIYLIILFIVYYRKKYIRLAVANLIIASILDEEEESAKEEALNLMNHENENQTTDTIDETSPETAGTQA